MVEKASSKVKPAGEASKVTPAETKLTKRKAKQFEKYMEKKLKKDQRPKLMEELQQLAYKGVALQSSKNLLVTSKQQRRREENMGIEANVATLEAFEEPAFASEEVTHDKQVSKPFKKSFVPVIPELECDLHKAISDIKKSSLNPLQSHSDDEAEGGDGGEAEDISIDRSPPSPDEVLGEGDNSNEKLFNPPPAPTRFVLVNRTAEIMEQRTKLPIFAEEQRIMETIMKNGVTVICGETGSGKTTQVPQFLYEANFGECDGPNPGLIGVTQPRRVAAVSMAKRVAEELGSVAGEHVAYQIRYDSTVAGGTRIKFMTDGILLRELGEDFLLQKYSVLLLDEAHERNLNTDILIGMLSRCVRMRNQLAWENPSENRPLRLVIMSATLNVDDFLSPRLFSPSPPILRVEARQHPVTMHFSRRTEADHVKAAFKIISKIHANLPPGGILVFLTGKQEIVTLAKRLNKKYGIQRDKSVNWDEDDGLGGEDTFEEDEFESGEEVESDLHGFDSDSAEAGGTDSDEFALGATTKDPLHVLPLYSLLAPEEQLKVFQPPPEGHRLCVLATNVAETSLTIPNIKYVVDSGLVKQRLYDAQTGSQEFSVTWCSKASAIQRAGRAGRVGPGHCYRLYSSALFEVQFPEYSVPEIQRTPMEGLVLQLKTMGIDRPERFPLPSSPDPYAIVTANRSLLRMGALVKVDPAGDVIKITRLGRMMSRLPLVPIWSRLLIISLELNENFALAAALAAAASLGDPFIDGQSNDTEDNEKGIAGYSQSLALVAAKLELAGKPPSSDLLTWMNALIKYMLTERNERPAFCIRHHLMPKRMDEMHQQYQLLIKFSRSLYPNLSPELIKPTRLPRKTERDELSKLLAESLTDHSAERVVLPSNTPIRRLPFPAYRLRGYAADDPNGVAFLHPTSVLIKLPPKHLVYSELTITETGRYLKHVTAIEPHWIDA